MAVLFFFQALEDLRRLSESHLETRAGLTLVEALRHLDVLSRKRPDWTNGLDTATIISGREGAQLLRSEHSYFGAWRPQIASIQAQ